MRLKQGLFLYFSFRMLMMVVVTVMVTVVMMTANIRGTVIIDQTLL